MKHKKKYLHKKFFNAKTFNTKTLSIITCCIFFCCMNISYANKKSKDFDDNVNYSNNFNKSNNSNSFNNSSKFSHVNKNKVKNKDKQSKDKSNNKDRENYYTTLPWQQFEPNSSYCVCFVPYENCTNQIISAIAEAKQSVLVQAYVLTSYPIMKELILANNRNVQVKVIVDKNQYQQYAQPLKYLLKNQVPLWLDNDLLGLAHNKVIIIDDNTVITGSFNFTKSAQTKNAENLMIIRDKNLASQYTNNWYKRQKKAKKVRT